MVIGTAVFDKAPFKNVIVNGLVLAEDGEKMSKSKKNYPDPNEILEKYGADALRLYLIGTPIVKGEAIKFKESGVAEIVKTIHQFAFNTLTFVQQMVPLYEQKYGRRFEYYDFRRSIVMENLMDIMMLNYLQEFITTTHKEMDTFYLGNIVNRIEKFIGQLSRTYLNMNKSRLKSQLTEKDALDSLNTTHYCLKNFAMMIAPFAPFMADHIYLGLEPSATGSVHLQKLPVNIWNNYDQKLVGQDGINLIEKIIDARGEIRSAVLKSAKKPVLKQTIYLDNPRLVSFLKNIRETLEKE
jgi:isoleucyl-tRNA synthetase